MRNVLAAILGNGVALGTVLLFDWISHLLHPTPPGFETTDTAAVAAHIESAPVEALIVLVAGWFVASFDGVLIACLIGRAKRYLFAIAVGGLVLVATVSNLILIPHPVWVTAAGPILIVLAAWLATLVVPRLEPADPS